MMRFTDDVALKFATYLADKRDVSTFVKFLELSRFHRKLFIPVLNETKSDSSRRYPSIWSAFLSERWLVTVVRKRILAGTMPRCRVDELMEFFRHSEGTLPPNLDLVRIQVFSSVFPLFRILYPDYPLFERR